ncbi:MAG: hypothetical protein JWP27_1624 [Flaviaesturariibacter sp.]|nr:hypothetical protein [Flaviaesturariibacter sp.]
MGFGSDPIMKIFLKWFLGSFLLLTILLIPSFFEEQTKNPHLVDGLIVLLIGSALLAGLFYFLEVRFLPRRKAKLLNRLIELFSAVPISDQVVRFKVAHVDVYVETHFLLHLSPHGTYVETIRFHAPRTQIDSLRQRSRFRLTNSRCAGMDTYQLLERTPNGLLKARDELTREFFQ